MGNRFKNIGFWTSLVALIPIVGMMFFDYSFPPEYEAFGNSLVALLIALGIVSNPTTKNLGYFDDKENKE